MKRALLLLALAAAATACSQQPRNPGTVRLCTESAGCSEQSRSTATFHPDAGDDAQEDARIAALTETARRDPRAAFDLALRFYRGDGIRRNTYQAITWMRDAAERGYAPAQLALGRFYLTGLEEMGSDPAEAESWLSLAAEHGDPEATKLLREAREAKKNEIAYRRWLELNTAHWRGYWVRGYAYRSYWNGGTWLFY